VKRERPLRYFTTSAPSTSIRALPWDYRAVGGDYDSLGQSGRASEYYTKAFQLRDRASEREKLDIAAHYYTNITGELEKAAQNLSAANHKLPAVICRYGNLANVHAAEGKYEQAMEEPAKAYVLIPVTLAATKTPPTFRSPCSDSMTRSRHLSRRKRAIWMTSSCAIACTLWLSFSETNSAMATQQQWFAGRPERVLGHFAASRN